MSNSVTNMDLVLANQSSKEVPMNAFIDAASTAASFGRRATKTSGLTWGYYGGSYIKDGVPVEIANGVLLLVANTTNYIEFRPSSGVVAGSTTGFTAGSIPLYSVVCGASTVQSYSDLRSLVQTGDIGKASIALAGDDVVLSNAQASCGYLELSGALTANVSVLCPQTVKQYIVFNNTSGAFTVNIGTLAGSSVAIGQGKHATLFSNGINMVRLTADI